MKKTIITLASFLIGTFIYAQAPQGINYQGVLRDASGNLMVSQTVNLDLTIDNNNCNCTVYEETQSATTDAYGLFSVVVGSGTAITGTFSAIDWSNGVYSFGVKVNGGTVGSTTVQSVPYALFADSANGVKNSLWKNNAGLTYSMDKVAIGSSNFTGTFGSFTPTLSGGSFSANIANYIGVTNLTGWADALQIRVDNGSGSSSNNFLECGGKDGFGFFDPKFSINLTGSVFTKGSIRVDSIAPPAVVKNTMYGNSVPLAYGNFFNGGFVAENYGISSNATHPSTGVYEITLTNPAKANYFPIIIVTPYSAPSTTFLIANQSYNSSTKKITVRIISSTGTPTNAGFSIVVFGIAQ